MGQLKSMLMSKYGGRAGEERLKKGRAFEKEEAEALANARMAEIKREQTGQTGRTRMEQAGLMEREKLGQTGATERTRMGMRDTFKDRSGALQSAYEQMDKLYPENDMGVRINPATGKPFTEEAWQALTQRMSDAALKYSGAGGGQPEEPQGYGTLSTAGGRTFDVLGNKVTERPVGEMTTPEPTGISGTNLSQAPASWTPAGAPQGTAAARLRSQYEKENAPPMIGADTLKWLKKKWKGRKESPYVEQPSGLRGLYR